MLMVKTRVGASRIHGVGLFATELIRKGTVVWRFVPGIDVAMPWHHLIEMPEPFRDFMETYSFKEPGHDLYIMGMDNDRFQNHSSTPNIVEDKHDINPVTRQMVAARDIMPGEEILSNYREWDATADHKDIP